jgi:hypothetical protein
LTTTVARPSSKQSDTSATSAGLERVGDQDLARLVPADDVDLLAAQLVNDVLDAAAAHADARADRVHFESID